MTVLLERPYQALLPADDASGNGSSLHLLENGDHLSRAEFERRYAAMPRVKKAELIRGRVYMASPTRLRSHGGPHGILAMWLGNYCADTVGVEAADNSTVRLDEDSEPQPDLALFVLPEYGGQTRISEDDYLELAPEFVAEVAASTASYDLHEKLQAYEAAGVREYLVVRTLDREVDWLVLREGRFERTPPGPDGIFRSERFPGLWLDAGALLAGNRRRVRDVLDRGIAAQEHAEFVGDLSSRAHDRAGHG
jgi:Uma2 family endonuclease